MSGHDELPPLSAEEGGDQARSIDPEILRDEIYRLRDRIAEMEREHGIVLGQLSETRASLAQNEGLGAAYDELFARHQSFMGRAPLRAAIWSRRRLRQLLGR